MKQFLIGAAAALALAVALSLLGGCAELNAARAGIATHGAQAMDQALDDAKWVTCQSTSIGALERELGGDPERIAGWVLYCGKKAKTSPLLAIPNDVPPVAMPQNGRPLTHGEARRIGGAI